MEREQFNKLLTSPVLLSNETVDDLKALVAEFPSFQMGWMLYLKNLKQVKSPEFDVNLKKVAVLVPDRKMLFRFLNTNFHKKHTGLDLENVTPPVYKLGSNDATQPGDSLIDKFLLENPGTIRANREEGKPVPGTAANAVAAHSVEENDEIITETLATIYFEQKNYEKAQEAYRKLSLKYPEKSVYFATRIKEIEKLKNI